MTDIELIEKVKLIVSKSLRDNVDSDTIRKLAKMNDDFADLACDNAENPEEAMNNYEMTSDALYCYSEIIELFKGLIM